MRQKISISLSFLELMHETDILEQVTLNSSFETETGMGRCNLRNGDDSRKYRHF